MDLALNNLQKLICHKTHQTKPNQTKPEWGLFWWKKRKANDADMAKIRMSDVGFHEEKKETYTDVLKMCISNVD